ncbi:imidazolonepropionase [Halomonas elongata]|uniref:Imidazolonepropionase n=1 Tax=Halomonas elongata (strain ATCC 33173 / DSM 2581 / NBRC 15536 / NCIMB 2198 / 1H9) TaxID=768066 RepID=E1VCK7_HALED|nr:imidazolonepropionase [Halomonas elongata]WBF19645.1 imidazolonepropionase [Halomonas elongata]WPU48510.1 imidazolonepropionase [Halomonas elongata DSM 2581]CBV42362.1 imidazolonepropionase [Halomonas elongata DSM 2581]
MTHPRTRLLWQDVTVFDGQETLPDAMAVIVEDDRIQSLIPMRELSSEHAETCRLMGSGGVMTPGLVDCHTHLVFGGGRADEFEARLEGASYEEIARRGGGIISTVRDTREASEEELFAAALPRLDALLADGVTTVEIKSGYGLDVENELKMLRVARRLGEARPVRVVTSLLGAHALPPEYRDDSDGYIDLVCQAMIPAAAAEGLADAVDVFCEKIAFSVAQCERVFEAAQAHGLPIKAHAEQLSNLGGSAMAARHGALSADHIEYLDDAGIAAMRDAGSVAVILPGAFHTLRETQRPPIAGLREAGVPMAVATDANPGSSPLFMPTLMLNLACTLFRLTPREALTGMTAHGARALGMPELGRLHEGAPADLCLWNIDSPAELAYAVQPGRLRQRVVAGQPVEELAHGQ